MRRSHPLPGNAPSPGSIQPGLDPDALEHYAAIAGAICDASRVLVIQLAPPEPARVVLARGFERRPPQAEPILRLHLDRGRRDEAFETRLAEVLPAGDPWAGWHCCSVALRDEAAHVTGLLCVLREHELPSRIGAAMAALGIRLAAFLRAAGRERRLADTMSELAWLCDPPGTVLWCNRAFSERLGEGPARQAFLARWPQAATHGEPVPARLDADRSGWFSTRILPAGPQGAPGRTAGRSTARSTPQFGFATEITALIEAEIELARLGPLREPPRSSLAAFERALGGIAERIGRRLPRGPTLQVRAPHDRRIDVRCEAQRLEAALLDVALACAAAPDPGVLTMELSSASPDRAVLTLTHDDPSRLPPLSALPMLEDLLRRCGGRAEPSPRTGLRILLPLHRPANAEHPVDPARILVVDDEAVVRMLVVDLLRERGHTVQEAEDAFAAMAMVQEGGEIDLMITDIGLPGGFDGSTLARRTRQLRPELPILFITGYAFGTNNDVTLEPGIPVLTKPFTLGALSARIAELLPS